MKLIRTTDILVGAHGAALTHMMYLPTTSASIEFWIDDRYPAPFFFFFFFMKAD